MKVYAGMDPRIPLRDVAAYARRVETLGYDGLHVAETVHDGFTVAFAALEHTERLTVRTSITLAFVRSPTLTAYTAWDLATFSAGRFQLGLGSQIRQNIEDRFGMTWSEPVARLREYVDAVQALFAAFRTGEPPHVDGEHYRITRLQPYFNPGPAPDVPAPLIYLGGVNPGMCRLAGSRADGFVTHPTNSDPRYLTSLCRPALEEGLTRSGRSWADLELVCGARVVTGSTRREVEAERERQRRLLAFLYSTPAYRPTLELYGWEHLTAQLQTLIRADRWDDLPQLVTDEVMDALTPTALYPDLAPMLLERYAGLADGIVLSPPENASDDDALADAIAALQAG